MEDEFYRSMRWHAPNPQRPKEPLCGTVGEDGRPTHRVSTTLTTTCKRCLKKMAALKTPNDRIQPRR